jgi:hypothetical protein
MLLVKPVNTVDVHTLLVVVVEKAASATYETFDVVAELTMSVPLILDVEVCVLRITIADMGTTADVTDTSSADCETIFE